VDVPGRKNYAVDALLTSAVLIWGFNYAIVKMTFKYFHPIAFNAVRFSISSAAMFLVLKIRGEGLGVAQQDIRQIVWLGFIGNTVYQFLFALGLARTGAGNSALIMALSPVFAFLVGVAMGRERFSRTVLAGIIMSLAGVAGIVVSGPEGLSFGESWRGDLLMMTASIIWGWQSAESTRLLGRYGPIRLTVTTMIAGTVMMVPLSIPWIIAQPWSRATPLAWLGLGFSALLSIAYSYFVWAHALNTIGVAHTSVFNNLTPIVALFAGWILLGERPVAAQVAGVVLVLVGVFIVRSQKPMAIPDD